MQLVTAEPGQASGLLRQQIGIAGATYAPIMSMQPSDYWIARDLPAHQTTPIEFTPSKAGEFTFTCGMNMLRGKLVVVGA